MTIYHIESVVCIKSGDICFSAGEFYEILEEGDVKFIECDNGSRRDVFIGNKAVTSLNSEFKII